MVRAVPFIFVLCVAASPFDPYPLTDSQLARLETADDGSATIDEAALYALLENAAQWSDTQAGAVTPDYQAIRHDPSAWRGTRCLIEGTVYRVLRPELSRQGWEKVEGIVVRVNQEREKPTAADFVIVYLTEPPDWRWPNPRYENEGIPFRQPVPVRLVGRFFKVSSYVTEGSRDKPRQEAAYLTFVGRSTSRIEAASSSPGPDWKMPALLAMVLVAVAVLAWRMRAGGARVTRLQDYLDQRRAQRVIRGEGEEDEEIESPDLPENPADALDALADKRRPEDE